MTYPNGKVYIGQTRRSVAQRWSEHVYNSKELKMSKNMICDAAIRKYGKDNVKLEVLEEIVEDKPTILRERLNDLETFYIKEFDSTNRYKGYNIVKGGHLVGLEQDILNEAWYDSYEKTGWQEMIDRFAYVLFYDIQPKIVRTHEKLDKYELYVWYGYKFIDYDIGKETTFNGFYKRHKNDLFMIDIGDFENGIEPEGEELESYLFNKVIRYAIEKHWMEDIRQTIWREVMKRKKKILSEYNLKNMWY